MDDRTRLPRRLVNTAYIAVLAYLERRIPFWPMERLKHLQQHRLRSIIQHAYDTVPFYRQVMEERHLRPEDFKSFADLSVLPLLDDSFVWSNLKQFMSSQYRHRPVLTFHTSGTYSKIQKPIYWDRLNALRRLAYNERDRAVLNKTPWTGLGTESALSPSRCLGEHDHADVLGPPNIDPSSHRPQNLFLA